MLAFALYVIDIRSPPFSIRMQNVVKMTIEHKNIPVADRCGYDGQFSRTNEFWKLYFKENITKIVGFRQASLTEEDSDDD